MIQIGRRKEEPIFQRKWWENGGDESMFANILERKEEVQRSMRKEQSLKKKTGTDKLIHIFCMDGKYCW